MVFGVEFYGFGEVLYGFGVVLGFEGLIALVLELGG